MVFYVNQNPWTFFDPLGLDKDYTGPVEPDGTADHKRMNTSRAQEQNAGYDIDIHSSTGGFYKWEDVPKHVTIRKTNDQFVSESGEQIEVRESDREQMELRISNSPEGSAKYPNPNYDRVKSEIKKEIEEGGSNGFTNSTLDMLDKAGGYYRPVNPKELATDIVSDVKFTDGLKNKFFINGCECGKPIIVSGKQFIDTPAQQLVQAIANESGKRIQGVSPKGNFSWERPSRGHWERTSSNGWSYPEANPQTR